MNCAKTLAILRNDSQFFLWYKFNSSTNLSQSLHVGSSFFLVLQHAFSWERTNEATRCLRPVAQRSNEVVHVVAEERCDLNQVWQEDRFCFAIIYLTYISNSFQSGVKGAENGKEISTPAPKLTFIYLWRIPRAMICNKKTVPVERLRPDFRQALT